MKYVVATQGTTLNVRSKPEPTAPIIGKLQKGALVDIDPSGTRGVWMKLRAGGYCSGDYLKPSVSGATSPVGPPTRVYTQLPNLRLMWDNYPPTTDSEAVKKLIGGGADAQWIKNTCTLRISRAFNYAGDPIPKSAPGLNTVTGADGMAYAFRVAELASYMEKRYGPPTHRAKGPDARNRMLGKKGILMFDVPGWNNATGHYTMWNGTKARYGEYFGEAREVLLWC